MRMGRMLYSESFKKTERNISLAQQVYKRPYGVAVLNLTEMVEIKEFESEEKEFTFKVSKMFVLFFFRSINGTISVK